MAKENLTAESGGLSGTASTLAPLAAEEAALAWQWLLLLRQQGRAALREGGLGQASDGGAIVPAAEAMVTASRDGGWQSQRELSSAAQWLLDLYWPLAVESAWVVGHLGQSLDGFIATESGDSHYVTGPDNITHLHRMRALCDAIVVGAGTVYHDNPRLTTRRVAGPHPVRVVLDPNRRLNDSYGLFADGVAPTVVCCRADLVRGGACKETALIGVGVCAGQLDLHELIERLGERGWRRIFIEGGGVTVSRFLQAGLLDRLQLAVAPLIIGSGRRGIALPPIQALSDGLRPRCRRFVMGDDTLFDLELG